MRYTISIVLEADHIPSGMLDELASDMAAQCESLDDGTYDDCARIHYRLVNWAITKE